MAHVNDAPPPMATYNPNIAISEEMALIVQRCLEKDPQRRFASMDELLSALKRCGGGSEDMMTGPYQPFSQSGAYRSARPSAIDAVGDSGPSGPMRRISGAPPGDSGPSTSTSLSLSGARPAALGFSGPNSLVDPLAASQPLPRRTPRGRLGQTPVLVGGRGARDRLRRDHRDDHADARKDRDDHTFGDARCDCARRDEHRASSSAEAR